jgi:dipeptidyl aminopeptidase/acylaminoacyl peptidase
MLVALVVGVFVALAVLALAFLLGVAWIGSERALRPRGNTYPWRLADFPDLAPEEVRLSSGTGITIAGRFFPGRRPATIVLSNGYGEHQDQMLPVTDFLTRAGFSVFTYDMRSRGRSDGRYVTLGALEQADLMSVVDYLASRPDVDAGRIGAFGLSLGASVSVMAAAHDRRIRAVVADCGFSDAPGIVSSSFEHFVGLPSWPFGPVTVRLAERRAGVSIHDVRPVDVVGAISPRPLLLIHGTDDIPVPPENSQRLFDHAGEPKELWWVPGAGHAQSRDVAGAEYDRRVIAFFEAALG